MTRASPSLRIANTALADPFDEKIARKWVDEAVMKFPRDPAADCSRRPLAEIAIKNTRSEAIVINVDYRLAPEYKLPLPLNDCYQAVQWTLDHAQEYDIDTARIAIWGCSAGGNLAAAVALRDAEEYKELRIRHVNLVVPATYHPQLYPMTLKADDSSSNKFGAGLGTAAAAILIGKYAGDGSLDSHVSVLSADIPANHPPVHITVAGRDFCETRALRILSGLGTWGSTRSWMWFLVCHTDCCFRRQRMLLGSFSGTRLGF